ncbi:MAG: ABC transporter substrate-binding protein [Streptosporangiaceae bacterium]
MDERLFDRNGSARQDTKPSYRPARRDVLRGLGLAAAGASVAPLLNACGGGSSSSSGGLTVWWGKGFYEAEDEAVKKVVDEWSSKTGKKVSLQFYNTDDIETKVTSAVTAGQGPDILYQQNTRAQYLAYKGELAEIGEVVKSAPLTANALKAARHYNSKKDASGYYAVPIMGWTTPLFHWKDMLAKVGMDYADAPSDWHGYWRFFEDAQKKYRGQGTSKVYAIGWPMSTAAPDTHEHFQIVIRAFGGQLLNDDGTLATGAGAKKALTEALAWVTNLYQKHYTPKGCISWDSGGNNTAFLNQQVLLTPNGSLSIPGAVQQDNHAKWEKIVTTKWPDSPAGGPTPTPWKFGKMVLFAKSDNQDTAKDLMKHIVRPKSIQKFLSGGRDRWFPTLKPLIKDPYWSHNDDPNVAAIAAIQAANPVVDWRELSLAWSRVEDEDLEGKAMGRVLQQGQSVSDSANQLLEATKHIFQQYEHA